MFDGTDFKGLDSDTVNSEDGTEEVLDTWLEHRLRGNEYYLLKGHDSISYQWIAGSSDLDEHQTGDRPFASVEWSTILCIPYMLQSSLESLTLDLLYRVGCEGVDGSGYDLRVELRDRRYIARAVQHIELANTSGLTSSWQTERIELELTDASRRDEVGWLIIWGRSRVDSVYGSSDGTYGDHRPMEGRYGNLWEQFSGATPDIWDAESGSPPNDSHPHELALVSVEDNLERPILPPLILDVLRVEDGVYGDYSASLSDYDSAYCLPTPATAMALGQYIHFERRFLSYIQCRSVCIEERHSLDHIGYTSEHIRANMPLRGSAATAHARLARLAESRPRPLWIGPSGSFGVPEEVDNQWSSAQYAQRWQSANGLDATSTPFDLAGYNATITPCTTTPIIDVWLWFIGVHLKHDHQLENYTLDAVSKPRSFLDFQREAALATWEIDASIISLGDGDTSWSEAATLGSASRELRARHYPTDPMGTSPFLFQQWLLHAREGASAYDFIYREGQLYESDISLIQPVRLTFELTGATSAAHLARGARLELEVSYVGDASFATSANPDDDRNTSEFLELVCVGASAWQRKELTR